jgi:hypothetical protein
MDYPFEGGHSETDEIQHQHYCEECGGIWGHDDESCMGPRFAGRMKLGLAWTCPMCEDPR